MNEEEKEAMKLLENIKNNTWVTLYIMSKDSKDADILLNLIEKQQAEIEKLRNNNKDLLRKLRNRVKEVKKLEKYSLYKKEFATLNKQLKEKDKIIDLMALDIYGMQIECNRYFKDTEEVKQYFERKIKQ